MAILTMRVDWKYATIIDVVQSVMKDGMINMLVWCVHNWDLDHLEDQLILDLEVEKY